MTTGEKIAALRRQQGITQEGLAEILAVSRQSVSRWEQDAAFPETEKLIRLSRLLSCSIDYLLNNEPEKPETAEPSVSAAECCRFIRECGYFFLATAAQTGGPQLRPMGFICAEGRDLLIATDKRKKVYAELIANPQVAIGGYNLNSRRVLRISGTALQDGSQAARDAMLGLYPMITQEFIREDELSLAVFRISLNEVRID